ncbi:MAG: polysaccharide deacetylase family protein [Candidatus Woesearchaeota archaeon]|nr:polysaccharide deacetylase family protein [Candidatus Woesearchaeota archaeon]
MHGLEKIVLTGSISVCLLFSPSFALKESAEQKIPDESLQQIVISSPSESPSVPSGALEEVVKSADSPAVQNVVLSQTAVVITAKPYVPKIYTHSDTTKKEIAITIDDIYDTKLLRKALDLADKYGVKFTLFPIGKTIQSNPEIYKEALKEGHEIELHSYTHAWATNKEVQGTADKIYANYANGIKALRDYVDSKIVFHFARPPGGAGYFGYINTKLGLYTPLSQAIGRLKNYNFSTPVDAVLWNGDSMFVNGKLTDSAYVYSYFKKWLSPGDIFLYHTREADFAVMESIIKYAKENGYKMVTLAELLGK